jgi:hypothetical protein
MPIARNDADAKLHFITVPVAGDHPLLQLKAALDWEAIRQVVLRHLRMAGRNVDGILRGRRLDVGPYVPLLILMLVMRKFNPRDMEAYLAENAVARLFMGVEDSHTIQVRDHSTIARIYSSLGAEGFKELNEHIVQQAVRFGFGDPSTLSADTTAQELPIGYPHEAGILQGLAERCGRAVKRLRGCGKRGLATITKCVAGLRAKAKEYHLFAKTPERKDEILRSMVRQAKRLKDSAKETASRLASATNRNVQYATSVLAQMSDVAAKLLPQIQYWLRTKKVAKGKVIHAGHQMARAIVRNKPGKKVEFGLQYLVAAIGGGYLLGRTIVTPTGETKMPLVALEMYRDVFSAAATPDLFVYDRGGHSKDNVKALKKQGVKKIGIQPKGRAQWQVHGRDRKNVMSERGKMEGKIGTLKNAYNFNKPRQRRDDTVLAAGHGSLLSFNLNKFMRDTSKAAAAKAA